MARGRMDRGFELSRRDFFVTTGGALVGMAALGLVDPASAGKRRPQQRAVDVVRQRGDGHVPGD